MSTVAMVPALIVALLICFYALRRATRRDFAALVLSKRYMPTTVACVVSTFFIVPAFIRGDELSTWVFSPSSPSMWFWSMVGYAATFVMIHTSSFGPREERARDEQRATDVFLCVVIPWLASVAVVILIGILLMVAFPFAWLFAWLFGVN